MQKTKGIAVSQIILLVLGILVLAVVGFLLYSQFVTTGNSLGAQTCMAESTRICTGCKIGGYNMESCPYNPFMYNTRDEQSDSTMESCVRQNHVSGNLEENTINCKTVTGMGNMF